MDTEELEMPKSKPAKVAKKNAKPDFVTPEYIAEQRAKREQIKLEKAKKNAEMGILPPEPVFDTNFIKRPMLSVQNTDIDGDGAIVKIMTYNVLGQALIRRKLFPTNGDMLKWKWRAKVLFSELKYYDADLMCLQEVDLAHLDTVYKPKMANLGYDTMYHCGERKNHGLLICWKNSVFGLVDSAVVDYDNDTGYDPADQSGVLTVPQTKTRNVGLIVALKFKAGDHGLVIGTTHLFWHPYGTFERTRQSAVLVRNTKSFATKFPNWPVFLAGDFNSLPFDAPYLALTRPKGQRLTDHAYEILRESAEHEYTKKDEEEAPEDDDALDNPEPAPEPEPVAVEEKVEPAKPKVLEEFTPSTDGMEGLQDRKKEVVVAGKSSIDDIMALHDNNNAQMTSLYGKYYRHAHPENADVDVRNGEPTFSNWAFAWRGLLDYIFVMNSYVDNIDVLELLRMPLPTEMGDEPSGQPREGQYPSDHLCLMAKIRTKL
ncbi:Endonuclease/exonuclease/phosphatase [Lipomyces arxii]|uniref:Endonuclease/exonuclease/phosphatase n=1 Tax=Lipomyces arxii TaxID=56418 RepID=UPI0034CF1DD7